MEKYPNDEKVLIEMRLIHAVNKYVHIVYGSDVVE